MSELQLFNPEALKQRVAETIQATFGSLIPDDVFAAMVQKGIDDFFHNKSLTKVTKTSEPDPNDRSHYNRRYIDVYHLSVEHTPFEYMVYEAVHKLTQTKLQEFLEQQKEELAMAIAKAIAASPEVKGTLAQNLTLLAGRVSDSQVLFSMQLALNSMANDIRDAFARSGNHEAANHIMSTINRRSVPDSQSSF